MGFSFIVIISQDFERILAVCLRSRRSLHFKDRMAVFTKTLSRARAFGLISDSRCAAAMARLPRRSYLLIAETNVCTGCLSSEYTGKFVPLFWNVILTYLKIEIVIIRVMI